MLLAEKNEEQLKYLDDIITKQENWSNNKFIIMNNEAGSGKSQQTFESIAKLALNTDKKIVYVQMFSNKETNNDSEELVDTIAKINTYANKEIADYICSNLDNYKNILKQHQVICITHRKYEELCKIKNKNFINDADVLLIDEFPNLFNSFSVSEDEELQGLQGFTITMTECKKEIEELNKFLLTKLKELYKKYGTTQMEIINLQKMDIKKYIKTLNKVINYATKKDKKSYSKIIEYAKRVLELFTHSCVYYVIKKGYNSKPAFYSFYNNVDYILAKENNIILDANGGFDERYNLRKDIFDNANKQSKVFDYNESYINFYPISTTKSSLKNYTDIIQNVVDYIEKEEICDNKNKYLIVADKERENKVTNYQKEQLHEKYNNNLTITHFGALLGKNDWRDYNNIWIVKTPFYSWVDYILQYMFYSRKNLSNHYDCSTIKKKGIYNTYLIFKNAKFNKFKNSIVKGEIYQALKRIARDGRKCNYNVLMAEEDICVSLEKEFKNINENINTDFEVERKNRINKKAGRKPIKLAQRNDTIKEYLLMVKGKGKDKIKKSELCGIAGIKNDKLSRQLKQIKNWLEENDIEIGIGKNKDYIIIKNRLTILEDVAKIPV